MYVVVDKDVLTGNIFYCWVTVSEHYNQYIIVVEESALESRQLCRQGTEPVTGVRYLRRIATLLEIMIDMLTRHRFIHAKNLLEIFGLLPVTSPITQINRYLG